MTDNLLNVRMRSDAVGFVTSWKNWWLA